MFKLYVDGNYYQSYNTRQEAEEAAYDLENAGYWVEIKG